VLRAHTLDDAVIAVVEAAVVPPLRTVKGVGARVESLNQPLA
jgi:hypothetical protein